jgi:hypothetical protein
MMKYEHSHPRSPSFWPPIGAAANSAHMGFVIITRSLCQFDSNEIVTIGVNRRY